MSAPPTYAQACRPPSREVAGIRLAVFTVGHALFLRDVGNPLIPGDDPDPDIWLGDLALALAVCEQEAPNDHRLAKRTVRIAKELDRRNKKHSAEWWEAILIAEFRDYLAESMGGPAFVVKAEAQGGRASGADWLQSLILDLMSAGYSNAEVVAMPFGKARWDWAAYWEKKGTIEIENDDDRKLMALADRIAAGESVISNQ